MTTWGDLFSPRQLLALTTLARLRQQGCAKQSETDESVRSSSSDHSWHSRWTGRQTIQLLSVAWECHECSTLQHIRTPEQFRWFGTSAEANPFGGSVGALGQADRMDGSNVVEQLQCNFGSTGHVEQSISATHTLLPDDAASALVTDPPYYDAVPYADLSDFFYVWLQRSLPNGSSATCS